MLWNSSNMCSSVLAADWLTSRVKRDKRKSSRVLQVKGESIPVKMAMEASLAADDLAPFIWFCQSHQRVCCCCCYQQDLSVTARWRRPFSVRQVWTKLKPSLSTNTKTNSLLIGFSFRFHLSLVELASHRQRWSKVSCEGFSRIT